MAVFNADVLTDTAPPAGLESVANPLILGRGKIESIADKTFLQAAGVQPGVEQNQTSGDESVLVNGKVTLSTKQDFFDYTYGSVYSVTMGQTVSTVVGKQRGWYRSLPDGDTTTSSYYTGVDVVDPVVHPGYDVGEEGYGGQSALEVKAVFNEALVELQLDGLTQVRLVTDHLLYGESDKHVKTVDFQYGNVTSRIKGDDHSTQTGSSYETFQGDRKRSFDLGNHTVVTMGAELTSFVGHESGSAVTDRLQDAENTFNAQEQDAPSNAPFPQWESLIDKPTQHGPFGIASTEGFNIALNLDAQIIIVLLRNAISLVYGIYRIVSLKGFLGSATLFWGPVLMQTVFGASIKAFAGRVAGMALGMLRLIPAPPPAAAEGIELPVLPPIQAIAADGAADAAGDISLDAAGTEILAMTPEALEAAAAEVEAAAAAAEAAAVEAEAAAAAAAQAEAEAAAELAGEFFAGLEEQAEAEAAAAATGLQMAGALLATGSGLGALFGNLGIFLGTFGSGEHLPDSSLGQTQVEQGQSDTSGPGGFEISQ